LRAAEQDRPDIAGKRRRWRVWQRFMDPARFVFLDETATTTNMARRYGRSPSGTRLVAAVPHGHWKTTTFIAGLRQSGLVAPLVLDRPMTGAAFRAYVEQLLAPALAPGCRSACNVDPLSRGIWSAPLGPDRFRLLF
jgi:hypothetical protein